MTGHKHPLRSAFEAWAVARHGGVPDGLAAILDDLDRESVRRLGLETIDIVQQHVPIDLGDTVKGTVIGWCVVDACKRHKERVEGKS